MKKFRDTDMQLLLGQVLRAGTVISICVVFFGGIIYLARHGQSIANYKQFKGIPDFVSNAKGLFNGAITFRGQAIIQLGIILLIATPIMRVVFSTVGFALEKDYLYVGISLLVLCIICFSMINGHAG
jgi:uncharacterized membrane protein